MNKIKTFLNKVRKSKIENSIYMKTLEYGYLKSNEGISFDEVVKYLDVDISNVAFKVNFCIWFYTNFYNYNFESKIVGQSTATNPDFRITEKTIEKLSQYNDTKSYIKGDSINKYIDFLELKRTRKASRNATYLSFLSLILAILSIIVPRVYPKNDTPSKNIEKTKKRNKATKCKFKDSVIAKPRVEKVNYKQADSTAKLKSKN